MEHHDKLPANVARALLDTGRDVLNRYGKIISARDRHMPDAMWWHLHSPYYLASPEPLTPEQSRAVGEKP